VNHTYNSSIDTRIKISSFTIQNARTGIYVYSDNNTINDNIIQNITQGNYPRGIFVAFASNNSIYGNVIRKNDYGIVVWRYHTLNNKIENNFIENNSYGILIKDQVRNTIISHNTIINNVDYGISAEWCFNTVVEKNNIYKNHPNANFIVFFEEGSLSQSKITWNGNYWGKIVLRHKFIFGGLGYYFPSYPYYYHFNWLNFDWFPAKEPYDIPGMS
jgi:parallel beta-helix repeat protein